MSPASLPPGSTALEFSWLVDCILGLERGFDAHSFSLGGFLRSDADEPALVERHRDIFPLPLPPVNIDAAEELDPKHELVDDVMPFDLTVRVANLSLRALNVLSGFTAPVARLGVCAPQRAAQRRALDQAKMWISAVRDCSPPSGGVAFGQLIHDEDLSGAKKINPKLDAMRCDLLERSGEVDPLPHVAQEHRVIVNTADALLPYEKLDWVRAGRIGRDDRAGYAKLVVRQLRCKNLLLPFCGGQVEWRLA